MFASLKGKIDSAVTPSIEHMCQFTNPYEPEPKFRFAFNWVGQTNHGRKELSIPNIGSWVG